VLRCFQRRDRAEQCEHGTKHCAKGRGTVDACFPAQLFFNEITTERARELFSEFVGLWNGRRLPAKYYRGIEGTTMRRTQHSWAVRGACHPCGGWRTRAPTSVKLRNFSGDLSLSCARASNSACSASARRCAYTFYLQPQLAMPAGHVRNVAARHAITLSTVAA